jgi:hypothetical protein
LRRAFDWESNECAPLKGPFDLSVNAIDCAVKGDRPGVFALGRLIRSGQFAISRVGRAELDLSSELKRYIATEVAFKFAYTETADSAFVRECLLFHSFRPPGNFLHPVRPAGSRLMCPRCQLPPPR